MGADQLEALPQDVVVHGGRHVGGGGRLVAAVVPPAIEGIQTAEITPPLCCHLAPFKQGKFGAVWALDGYLQLPDYRVSHPIMQRGFSEKF